MSNSLFESSNFTSEQLAFRFKALRFNFVIGFAIDLGDVSATVLAMVTVFAFAFVQMLPPTQKPAALSLPLPMCG
jgi:hypothetical protein